MTTLTVTGTYEPSGRTVRVDCPFCGRRHTHGAPNGTPVGERLSHCSTDRYGRSVSPGSYFIVTDPA